jgi:hypothetical protein
MEHANKRSRLSREVQGAPEKMMAKLTKYPSWAKAFLEYVDITTSMDNGRIASGALRHLEDDIRQQCTPEVFKLFTRLMESPCTRGAIDAYAQLKEMGIPQWGAIEVACAPLEMDKEKEKEPLPKQAELFPGCRSKVHSHRMRCLTTDYSMALLLEKWEAWNKALDESKARRQLSIETKKQFKHGDRVKFVDEATWKGKYGIVQMDGADGLYEVQCVVREVEVDAQGQPCWDKQDRYYLGGGLCGYYHEIVHV